MLVKSGEAFDYGVLAGIERKNLVALRIADQFFFVGPDLTLEFGYALGKKLAGAGVGFVLLLEIGAHIGIGDGVGHPGSDVRIAMGVTDVDQTGLFVIAGPAFAHGFDVQAALERGNVRGQAFRFGQVIARTRRCDRSCQRQIV